MSRITRSLNFCYCMERFATQIYRTQVGAFRGNSISQKLSAAKENEMEHVLKLRRKVIELKAWVWPIGFLFQTAGFLVGMATRISGKHNLLKADVWVERRAIQDYNKFLNRINFDANTKEMLREIINEEEKHVLNWSAAKASLADRVKSY